MRSWIEQFLQAELLAAQLEIESVAELVCSGETLQAELKVPEAGVGRLKVGQGVKLKYDAFPYQRYGGDTGWCPG